MRADSTKWFDVDREGLAKLIADRSPAHALFELASNAWDTRAKVVEITLEPEERGRARLVVGDDDPEGFTDLSRSWTLFAESERRGHAEKRGRFCVGEKLVLAQCVSAEIVTTRGGVRFDAEGRHVTRSKTATGSVFRAVLRMNRAEVEAALADFRRVIPPKSSLTRLNGEVLVRPALFSEFDAVLPTVRVDEEGNLRRSERRGRVHLYRPRAGEKPTLYEMGIPVVELTGGETFHADVMQKCPLNGDRDNVTPAFLRALRVAVLNHASDLVVEDEASATTPWVREAAGDERCGADAIEDVLHHRFGDNRVAYDPSDPEAVGNATAAGATVVHGGSLSAGEWENARRAGAILPAGRLYPSHMSAETTDDYRVLPEGELTRDMCRVARLSNRLSAAILGVVITVRFIESKAITYAASWNRTAEMLTFNVSRLGRSWFAPDVDSRGAVLTAAQLELLLHEFAHHRGGSNHLDDAYHAEICRLGVKLAQYVSVNRWPSEEIEEDDR